MFYLFCICGVWLLACLYIFDISNIDVLQSAPRSNLIQDLQRSAPSLCLLGESQSAIWLAWQLPRSRDRRGPPLLHHTTSSTLHPRVVTFIAGLKHLVPPTSHPLYPPNSIHSPALTLGVPSPIIQII